MELKAGDIVMLKSGGQPLTVADVKGDDVTCLWMGAKAICFARRCRSRCSSTWKSSTTKTRMRRRRGVGAAKAASSLGRSARLRPT